MNLEQTLFVMIIILNVFNQDVFICICIFNLLEFTIRIMFKLILLIG